MINGVNMGIKLGPEFKRVLKQREFKRMNTEPDVSEAFAILKAAIKEDGSFAYSWHANIAMAMYDAMPETFWMPDRSKHHEIANNAATTFMARCWDVDTSADMLEEKK